MFLVLAFGAGSALAVSTIPPRDQDLFAAPDLSLVRIAPSGSHLAAIADGRRLIVQRRGRRGQRPIHVFEYGQVRSLYWATDERLLLSLQGPGQSPGLAGINRDGSDYRMLIEPGSSSAARSGVQVLDLVRAEPASVLISHDARKAWAPDVIRLNIFNAERERVEKNPGRVIRWVTDRRGRIRLASAWRAGAQEPEIELRHRDAEDKPWRTLSRSAFSQGWWRPLSFASDNVSFYVGNDLGRDTVAIQRYSPDKQRLEPPIFSHERADAVSLLFSDRARPAVIPFDDGMPKLHFLDPDWRGLQRWVDRQQQRRTNRFISWSSDSRYSVVFSSSDVSAGRYLLLDRGWQTLTTIGDRRRSLATADLSQMELVSFNSEDGLKLSGYLTRPLSGGPWPLLVIPHGGPWARDVWGFSAVAQFFAAKGIAVLSVNYRGSEGFGRSFLMAGRGEWGRKMQADLDAGVRWAVKQRIAQPGNACLLGTSYGGYASLMGVIEQPELYRCAVSIGGASDLVRQIDRYKEAGNERAWLEWRHMVGDPVLDRARLNDVSPLHRAGDLTRPVLLFHGLLDQTVPAGHAVSLAARLESLGKSHELALLPKTGHNLHSPDVRLNVFRRAHEFIARHLGLAASEESAPSN